MAGERTGRPPLTERRKAATRLEVAREAVRLFASKGVAATSAEEIAVAAGISVRTLWRYFPNKESCVWPLLTAGLEDLTRSLRAWPRDQDIAELLDGVDDADADLPEMLALVRLTMTEPSLRAVWLQSHDDAEPVFVAVLAERYGLPAEDLRVRVRAAMINSALRVAVEHHARQGGTDGEPLRAAVREALRIVDGGVSD